MFTNDDIQLGRGEDFKPHASHKMTEWRGCIVQLLETPRHGSVRNCKVCEAEEAKTAAGHRAHRELTQPCEDTSERETKPPEPVPIDMVLHCPACSRQHIDAPDGGTGPDPVEGAWTNPPHRSHLCHFCGCIWRPADVPTNGVAATKTKGSKDTWVAK